MTDECRGCGTCCRLFLINLTEEEYGSGKYDTQLNAYGFAGDFGEAENIGANILRQKRGACVYLKGKRCSIHGTRPRYCREFFCGSGKERFRKMVEEINAARIRQQ